MDLNKTHKIAGNPWDDVDLEGIQDEGTRKVLERVIKLSYRDYDRFFELAQTTLAAVQETRKKLAEELSATNKDLSAIKNVIVGEPEVERPGLASQFHEISNTVKEMKEWQNKINIDKILLLEKDVQDLKNWRDTGLAIRSNDGRRIDWLHKLWPFFYIFLGVLLALLSRSESGA